VNSTGSGRGGIRRSTLKALGASLEKVDGSSGCEGSSERRAGIGCGRSDSLIASDSTIDSLASLKIEGSADGTDSGSLNETRSSETDVLDGERRAGSGTNSGGSESISSLPCKESTSGLEGAAGELDDNVPDANFHAPSKTVFHEKGTAEEESAVDGGGSSGSGTTSGLADGSTAKVDSLGSVRSGTGAGLGN